MDIPLEPTLLVGNSVLHGILDHVRNAVLDWALDLESRGIIGDGMSFSSKEKTTASQVTYQITNHIGSMQNSQIHQDSPRFTKSNAGPKYYVRTSGYHEVLGRYKVS